MSRRRRGHPLDSVIEPWARERRRMLGLADLMHPHEYLGRVKSTLELVRDERVAAGTSGRGGAQHFPEVYVGGQLLVNRAWRALSPEERTAIDAWYVWPGRIAPKLEALGWSEARFRETLAEARGHIGGWLAAHAPPEPEESCG